MVLSSFVANEAGKGKLPRGCFRAIDDLMIAVLIFSMLSKFYSAIILRHVSNRVGYSRV